MSPPPPCVLLRKTYQLDTLIARIQEPLAGAGILENGIDTA
jgi:hypothetical protein